MSDTTDLLEDLMIDPVAGEIIGRKDLAERLLVLARGAGDESGWPGRRVEPAHGECVRDRVERRADRATGS